jgi:thiosulfate/3-mercaptopyruvate sulfurtransferase
LENVTMKNVEQPRAGFGPLVETGWLASELGAPDLRVIDCMVFLYPLPDGSGLRAESGRAAWEAGHIPTSGFVDLLDEVADPTSPWHFALPPPEQFAEVMGRLGVGEGTRVVLYCRDHNVRAARVWWMLRAFGFDMAAVLNGGWVKWTLEGRSVSTEPCQYPPDRFVPRPRPELFVDKAAVRAAIDTPDARLINALTVEQHQGTGGVHYGRRGSIPSSVCVPARSLTDPTTHAYVPLEQLRATFEAVGALDRSRAITYCGAALAACSDAFILYRLGLEDISVYAASMQEWAQDRDCPLALP